MWWFTMGIIQRPQVVLATGPQNDSHRSDAPVRLCPIEEASLDTPAPVPHRPGLLVDLALVVVLTTSLERQDLGVSR